MASLGARAGARAHPVPAPRPSERKMKSVLALSLTCLLSSPAVAAAQDALPPGDVAIFSIFHARLVAAEELGTWAAGRLDNGKARGTARKVASHSRDGWESVTKFLEKYGAAAQPVTDDSLTLAAGRLRQELESLQGRALDSAWAHHVTLWLDEARVRAIFGDGKRLGHKKARGVESSLRWAWGNAYSFACALRTWFDRKTVDGRDLECGPPSEPAEGQASRT
jgi:hypothetical protein